MHNNINKYERFHSKTKAQSRIISENNFTYRHIIYFINKYLKKNANVLDIGCGAGTVCFYIAGKGNKVLGFDISPKAIRACQESSLIMGLNKLAKFKVINFPEQTVKEKFDLIIFSEVIEHLQNDNLALKKIYNLLNKAGTLIITTPSLHAPLYRIGYATGFDERVGHRRRYIIEGLSKQCGKSGFTIVETQGIEGVIRNFLFLNPVAGRFVRFIKFFMSDVVTFVDNLTIPIFGESNIIVVARKSS